MGFKKHFSLCDIGVNLHYNNLKDSLNSYSYPGPTMSTFYPFIECVLDFTISYSLRSWGWRNKLGQGKKKREFGPR